MTHFFLNHFFVLESTIISCFCILLCFSASFLSIFCKISSDAFNCLHRFFFSVLHLFKNRSDHQIRLLSLPFAGKLGFPQKTKSGVTGRYKKRIVIAVRPETLAFCFISWRRKRLLHRFQEKTESNQALSPKGASLWGAQRKNDPLCVLTRQTLKGRSLGLRSRNNASFRYRRFKSKISSTHWHLSTEGHLRDKKWREEMFYISKTCPCTFHSLNFN